MTASSMQQLTLQPSNNPSSGAAAAAAAALATTATTRPQPADQQGLRCPRCDSPNTKFCYYNNYSLTQPRHFCKSCRRYWTKGGALRNVPIGGGCRKPKRSRSSRVSSSSSSAAAASSLILPQQLDPLAGAGFDLSSMLPYSYHPIPGVAAAAAASSSSNHHLLHHGSGGSIASSIQSLSSINLDLHWKLQQQRLHAMMAAGGDRTQDNKGAETTLSHVENHVNDVSFHQVAVERPSPKGDHGDTTTAWFLDPYSMPNVNTTNYHHSSLTTNINNGSTSASDWIGIPTWSHDMHQFTAFP